MEINFLVFPAPRCTFTEADLKVSVSFHLGKTYLDTLQPKYLQIDIDKHTSVQISFPGLLAWLSIKEAGDQSTLRN
jgi:hypothetical protein